MLRVDLLNNGTPVSSRVFTTARVTVGRDAGCDLVVDDPAVSPVHASLTLDKAAVTVADEGSVNGIWSGGRRIARRKFRGPARVELGGTWSLQFKPGSTAIESGDGAVKQPRLTFPLISAVAVILVAGVVVLLALICRRTPVSGQVPAGSGAAAQVLDDAALKQLDTAKALYFDGEYLKAAGLFNDVLTRYPQQEDAWNYTLQIRAEYAADIDRDFMALVRDGEYEQAERYLADVHSVLGDNAAAEYRKMLSGHQRLRQAEDMYRDGKYQAALDAIEGLTVTDSERLRRLRTYARTAIDFKESLLVAGSRVLVGKYDDALTGLQTAYRDSEDMLPDALKEKYAQQQRLSVALKSMDTAYAAGDLAGFIVSYRALEREFGATHPALASFLSRVREVENRIRSQAGTQLPALTGSAAELYAGLSRQPDDPAAMKQLYDTAARIEVYAVVAERGNLQEDVAKYRAFIDAHVKDLYDKGYVLYSFGETEQAQEIFRTILSIVDEHSRYYKRTLEKTLTGEKQ